MTVRELKTIWGFNIDHSKLEKLEGQIEGIKHQLEFLAGVEAVKALFELAEKFGHLGAEIHFAAESAGITAEEFQKLAFSGQQANISQEEMGVSLKQLSRHLYEARQGSQEAALAFSNVGFSPEQVLGFKTSRDALLALADRFKNIRDPVEKAALAQQLLGRGGARMVGYLNQGSAAIRAQGDELQRLGLILSGPQVEALRRVEEAFNKLGAMMKALYSTIAAEIAPVFEYLVEQFIHLFAVNRDLIGLEVHNWLRGIAFAMGFLFGILEDIVVQFKAVEKFFGAEGKLLGAAATILGIASAIGILSLALSGAAAAGALLSPTLILLASLGAIGYGLYGKYQNGDFASLGLGGPPSAAGNTNSSSALNINSPINIFMRGGEGAQEVGTHLVGVMQGFWDQKMRETKISGSTPVKY